ncbi:hypothetical protein NJC38_03965 [Pseudomonas sp. 21LCFQ010]|uniref:hypothetical protein n=1 Tax=Pseudomonas sp. 21LCFQ010 TaxID=2957506 RepID=UPI002096EE71|nr:hypothetical protein [Pseudomonas sp. 21LCFQ010]MCO8161308.1 hypothetical protein [Pseudomonas sp. 21LCFQ010]
MRKPGPRCGTPLLYSGELQVRPELEAVANLLKSQPYTAIPGWRDDGTWELWTVKGDGQTSPRIISGPDTPFSSREAALEAGARWWAAQQEHEA